MRMEVLEDPHTGDCREAGAEQELEEEKESKRPHLIQSARRRRGPGVSLFRPSEGISCA